MPEGVKIFFLGVLFGAGMALFLLIYLLAAAAQKKAQVPVKPRERSD